MYHTLSPNKLIQSVADVMRLQLVLPDFVEFPNATLQNEAETDGVEITVVWAHVLCVFPKRNSPQK
jgi:hypothetical protein